MATAQVQTKSAITSSAASLSVNLSGVGAGNHLNCSAYSYNAATALTTSTPSATWSNALAQSSHYPMFRNDYSENVTSGAWTVTGHVTAASPLAVCVSESSGVATSASLGVTHTNLVNSAGTTIQPGSITPSAGSILYSGAGTTNGSGTAAPTIDSGFTVAEPGGGATVWDGGTYNFQAGTAYLGGAGGTAVNPTWTAGAGWPSPSWGDAFIVEYKAASGGTNHPVTVAATQTESATLTKQVGIPQAITQATVAALTKAIAFTLAVTQSTSSAVAKNIALAFAATVAMVATLAASIGVAMGVTQGTSVGSPIVTQDIPVSATQAESAAVQEAINILIAAQQQTSVGVAGVPQSVSGAPMYLSDDSVAFGPLNSIVL